MPITNITISIKFPSQTTARCWTRPLPTSPRGASRCLPSSARGAVKNKAFNEAIAYLLSTQEEDGSWYGRWGMNYIYGTWSVLCALNAAGFDAASSQVHRAVQLARIDPKSDGGWGEGGESYKLDYQGHEPAQARLRKRPGRCLGLWPPARSTILRSTGASIIFWQGRGRTGSGRSSASPRLVSHACSISAITATRNSSHFGPWPATAI